MMIRVTNVICYCRFFLLLSCDSSRHFFSYDALRSTSLFESYRFLGQVQRKIVWERHELWHSCWHSNQNGGHLLVTTSRAEGTSVDCLLHWSVLSSGLWYHESTLGCIDDIGLFLRFKYVYVSPYQKRNSQNSYSIHDKIFKHSEIKWNDYV